MKITQPLTAAHPPESGDFHGIEVDIASYGRKINVVFRQFRLEPALEEMARATVLVAGIKCVPRKQPLHESRKIRPRRLYEQMEVIFHQHEGVKLYARRVQAVCQLREKPLAVIVAPEDDSPRIATAGDMVNGVRKIDAWWACHAVSVSFSPTVGNREI